VLSILVKVTALKLK